MSPMTIMILHFVVVEYIMFFVEYKQYYMALSYSCQQLQIKSVWTMFYILEAGVAAREGCSHEYILRPRQVVYWKVN